MKILNIEIPSGYEIDLEQSNLTEGKVVFKEIKNELPKTWEELGLCANGHPTNELDKAEIAMRKLSQLREVYRQGWKPNWKNRYENKYVLRFDNDELVSGTQYNAHEFLSFQSAKIRDEFLNNFASLIETAKPLMS